uniref:RRM domain-containing protein n=1 Tax=Alexandrium catenella TaxID=2925 RepID=A0A7S1WH58_ALECA|mmetsp:Transcript_60218/g.161321  ORF Transcript_60218/g.161321 Transcript_60218/m.161321 type:complete len:615 (+) Transcript_60218:103-1947(+)
MQSRRSQRPCPQQQPQAQQLQQELQPQLWHQSALQGHTLEQQAPEQRKLWRDFEQEDDEWLDAPSPKMAMACPQPRRVFTTRSAPSAESAPGSPHSAQDDDACNELRELLGGTKDHGLLFGFGEAPDARPWSSASTSAGPTPGPDDRGFTPAHDRSETPQSPILEDDDQEWGLVERGSTPALDRTGTPQTPILEAFDQAWGDVDGDDLQPAGVPAAVAEGGRASKIGTPAQIRKVFVGGIPQNMNQEDLHTAFSAFGGVRKAWLQRHRSGAGPPLSSPQRNHRGFGFVVFHDGRTVEQLLGQSVSRFIALADGRKLEVKRAVSSNDMLMPGTAGNGPAPQQPAARSRNPPRADPPTTRSAAPTASSEATSMPMVPPGAPAALAAAGWPAGCNGGLPTMVQVQRGCPGAAGIYVAGAAGAGAPGILVQPMGGMAQMVQGGATHMMLAPGPAVCEQGGATMIQQQAWVVDPSSQAAMQLAMEHAYVPTAPPAQLLSPQPLLAPWVPNPIGGTAPSQWTSISATGGAVSSQTQNPACTLQWVQSHDGMLIAACPTTSAFPDADASPAMPDAACSGGGAAPMVLPSSLMGPMSQQPTYTSIQELESALLQAMPEYYDD